jgi:hypothetical protein
MVKELGIGFMSNRVFIDELGGFNANPRRTASRLGTKRGRLPKSKH